MPVPADQNFSSLQGSLGSRSVTIFGLTLFSDDPTATISINADHRLSFGTGTGTHMVGYKSADGTDFVPSSGVNVPSYTMYMTGAYSVSGFRDGALIYTLADDKPYATIVYLPSQIIDEVRFTYADKDLVIDDLSFGTPGPVPNTDPVISAFDGANAVYVEGAPAVPVDVFSNATVADSTSKDFDGGYLSFSITSGLVATEDRLLLSTGNGPVTLSNGMAQGSIVRVNGVSVGSVDITTGESGQELLAVALNAGATPASISEVLRAISYLNTNTTAPNTGTRTVTVGLYDGDGNGNGSGGFT